MAGFAGHNGPDHFKISTFAMIHRYHNNGAGHNLRKLRCRKYAFSRKYFTEPGYYQRIPDDPLEALAQFTKPWSRYMANDNRPKDPIVIAQVWASLFTELLQVDQVKLELLLKGEDEGELESFMNSVSHPLLYVNYTLTPPLLSLLRAIAFDILRVPAFCVCTFGEVALHALNLTTGIVVDFGFTPDAIHQEYFAAFARTSPAQVFVECVVNGARVHCEVVRNDMALIANAINTCYVCSNTDETASNVVLVGSTPPLPDAIKQALSPELAHKLNVYIVPESERAVFKGACSLAFSASADPAFYSIPPTKKGIVEHGLWVSKALYEAEELPERLGGFDFYCNSLKFEID